MCPTGDSGDGTVSNDPPFAHWTYTYNATLSANNYTCARADGASAYDAYTGAYPWGPSDAEQDDSAEEAEAEAEDPSAEELLADDYDSSTDYDSVSFNSTSGNNAAMQMANATFYNTTAGSNKWVEGTVSHASALPLQDVLHVCCHMGSVSCLSSQVPAAGGTCKQSGAHVIRNCPSAGRERCYQRVLTHKLFAKNAACRGFKPRRFRCFPGLRPSRQGPAKLNSTLLA